MTCFRALLLPVIAAFGGTAAVAIPRESAFNCRSSRERILCSIPVHCRRRMSGELNDMHSETIVTLDLSACLTRYEGHGVGFEYPDIWELTVEAVDRDVLLTVSADGVCFWALRILGECPGADEVIESCVAAFRDEYDDIEVQESRGVLAELPAVCREVEFSCFELLNSVSLSCVRSSEMSLLAWWQGTDHELTEIRAVFDRITQSVRILLIADQL